MVAFLDFAQASNAEGGNVAFGEGDNKKPLADAFKAFLGELPPVVAFGEHATKDRAGNEHVNPLVADAERRAGTANHRKE